MTPRDEAWHRIINQLVKTGHFQIGDLGFEEEKQHTVRRVLREMEELEWVTRESERATTWRAGELAALNLNISEDKLKQARG